MTTQEIERAQAQPVATEQGIAPSPVPKPVIAFFAAFRRLMGRAEDERECVYEPPERTEIGKWKVQMSVTRDELDGGFIAECIDLPGAVAQGETQAEAFENLIDAVQGVLAAEMEEQFRTIDPDTVSGTTRLTVTL
jgi:predicted RNase H-like HicB family nuclease